MMQQEERNLCSLPSDVLRTIFLLVPTQFYFNVHGVSRSFRRFLKNEIYDKDATLCLPERGCDLLASIVYHRACSPIKTSVEVVSMIRYGNCRLPSNNKVSPCLVRGLLHYDMEYTDDILPEVLVAVTRSDDMQVFLHIKKSNTLSFDLYHGMSQCVPSFKAVLFETIFNGLIHHADHTVSGVLTRIAESLLAQHKYELFDRLLSTGQVRQSVHLLCVLIDLDKVNAVKRILSLDSYTKRQLRKMKSHCRCSQEEMISLIDGYIG